ncbi:MAG: ECF transporter S component [Spirochaetes bacterium]|nr:ECF transporter S component [Spirochaetota bacterium]
MKNEKQTVPPARSTALRIASVAVLAAVTAVLTLLPKIPIPGTQGYVHLGDAAVVFTALVIGPLTALLAGGLGTAAADLLGGYAQWAPISFVVHGLQGLVIGLLIRLRPRSVLLAVAAGAIGTIVMAAGYFLGGLVIEGFGATLRSVLPNLLQAAAGAVLGIPLSIAVRTAYPPVRNLSW